MPRHVTTVRLLSRNDRYLEDPIGTASGSGADVGATYCELRPSCIQRQRRKTCDAHIIEPQPLKARRHAASAPGSWNRNRNDLRAIHAAF
jgi:hypothetical protein